MTQPLSPAAQAVLKAALPVYDVEHLYIYSMKEHAGMIAAAALRAVVRELSRSKFIYSPQILAIAAELERPQQLEEQQ